MPPSKPLSETSLEEAETSHFRQLPGAMLPVYLAQEILLDQFAPAAVLVNGESEVLYFCGPTEKFLLPPHGEPTPVLLDLLREGLRSQTYAALREAAANGKDVVINDCRVKRDGVFAPVKLSVKPIIPTFGPEPLLLLVVFEELPTAPIEISGGAGESDLLARQLEEERRFTEAELEKAVSRLDVLNQELRDSKAQALAAQKDLQSARNKLKELDRQLRRKLAELELANKASAEFLSGNDVALLGLDRELRIKWFTPSLAKLLKFSPADIGRSIGEFPPSLASDGLAADARMVFRTSEPRRKEICTELDTTHIRRIVPGSGEGERIEGVIVIYTDITANERHLQSIFKAQQTLTESLEQRLRESTARRRRLMVEVAMAEERERRALAQDLHDNLGQLFAILKIKLVTLDRHERRGHMKQGIKETVELMNQAIQSARSVAFQLGPPDLSELGLKQAIEWLTDEMAKYYGISVNVHDDGEEKPLDQTSRMVLFRAVRELLINVAKHAGVGVADVAMQRQDNNLAITVSDKGKGFDTRILDVKKGFGLCCLSERLNFIGSTLCVESTVGAGTRIAITAPLLNEGDVERENHDDSRSACR